MEWRNFKDEFDLNSEEISEWISNEYSKIRTGRVNPSIFDNIKVEAYGEYVPLNQIANIQVVDARQIMIRPYDKEQLKDISAAIAASNLGVNPQHNPDHLRIIFAPITEETRIASVKKAKTILEDAKIRIRRVRQDVQTLIKKTTGLSEDTIRHFDEELNKTTKEWNNKLEGLFAKKEAELMKI